MKVSTDTHELLDLLHALGARVGDLTAKQVISLAETTQFSKEFLLNAAAEEPAHVRVQDSIADIEAEAGRPIHEIGLGTWRRLNGFTEIDDQDDQKEADRVFCARENYEAGLTQEEAQ